MKSIELLQIKMESLLAGKRIAILGFGREGQSTYRMIRKFFPKLELLILDKVEVLSNDANQLIFADHYVETFLGSDYLEHIGDVEVIFKSPGVSPFLVQIQAAISRGAPITSQTNLLFELFKTQIIAVTGTKGKSTTSNVIAMVLKNCGEDVVFMGNIGSPAFDHVESIHETTKIVYEISSHQCEGLTASPHMGVFLNLFRDHLDYYPSMEAYGLAKRQLFVFQSNQDICIFNINEEPVGKLLHDIEAVKLGFSDHKQLPAVCYIDEGWLMYESEKVSPVSEIPLLGKHNLLNVMPAIIVAKQLGIKTQDLRVSLSKIKPVEKRLEVIDVVNGITFIDDALATIPEATIAAIETFGDQLGTLMVGGYDRGQEFNQLAEKIATSNIKNLIVFPTTGTKIAKLVVLHGSGTKIYPASDMHEAVKIALEQTETGKIALLSTASASFGLFKDYRDRSNKFREALHAF